MAGDFPYDAGFARFMNNMNLGGDGGGGSTSNNQFPGYQTQAPLSPRSLAYLESQQEAYQSHQYEAQHFQSQQYQMPTQQSISSNSIPTTSPKKGRKKASAKVTTENDVQRWTPDEEACLAKCWVATAEDNNVGRQQKKDTLWKRIMRVFNQENFQPRTKDMLSSKWKTLNHNVQKFEAIYKKCLRNKKSGENELDFMNRVRSIYQDENRNTPFSSEKSWAILRKSPKWDAPEVAPVDLTGEQAGGVPAQMNTSELFGRDQRPRPPGKQRASKKARSETSGSTGGSNSSQLADTVSIELRLRREAAERAYAAAQHKDETITEMEELRFLGYDTTGMDTEAAFFINLKKEQIKAKLRAKMPPPANRQPTQEVEESTDSSD